jgi:hypothetical protein
LKEGGHIVFGKQYNTCAVYI